MADASGSSEVLLFQNRGEFRAFDDAELVRGGELVGQHAGEVASTTSVPPPGRRVVAEIGNADCRLVDGKRRSSEQGQKNGKNDPGALHEFLLGSDFFGEVIVPRPVRSARARRD